MTRRKEEEHHVNHHFGCTFNFGVYFMFFFLFPFEKISNTQLAPDDKRSIVIEITGPIRYYFAHEKLNNAQTANTHTKSFSIVNHFRTLNNRICCLLWANECACIWYALTNNGLPCLVLSIVNVSLKSMFGSPKLCSAFDVHAHNIYQRDDCLRAFVE